MSDRAPGRSGSPSTVVIVPIKPLAQAKSRLRDRLPPAACRDLVVAMLADTLQAVRAAHHGVILVISADDAYGDVLRGVGASRVADDTRGYNEAVARALEVPAARDAASVLIVPADLPAARPDDLRRALDALAVAEVVVAPAVDGGTALLGLRPPGAVATAFGHGSAEAHRRAARAAGRSVVSLDLPSLARDVDTLDDLLAAPEALGPATRAFLVGHHLSATTGGD